MTFIVSEHPPATLRHGCGDTLFGVVLVARSDKGVAAILIGTECRQLEHELRTAFPTTQLIKDEAATAKALARLKAVSANPREPLGLTLDVRGSATELAVWDALRAIPAGETRSYGQIAKALPVPATAQEVGAACAANRLAIAIPCHRVIKADGSISGYRWGVARKRQFLQLERAA